DDGVEVADPDLAVADLAGLTGSDDGLGDLVGVSVVDDDVDTQFGEELDFVFGASVDLGVAALAAVPSYFSDGHALDPGVTHGFGHVIEFVRLDDGHDCSHGFLRSRAASRNARGSRGGGGGPNPAAPRVAAIQCHRGRLRRAVRRAGSLTLALVPSGRLTWRLRPP